MTSKHIMSSRITLDAIMLHPSENVDLIAHRDDHSMEITIFLRHQENNWISLKLKEHLSKSTLFGNVLECIWIHLAPRSKSL